MKFDPVSPYGTILAGVDGSDAARRAAAHALYLSRALGSKLLVLYVVDTHSTQALGVHYHEAVQELRASGQTAIDEVLDQARELSVNAEAIIADGSPGQQICQVARERQVDLVVMGAKGKSALEEMLLGSVSNFVLHHAQRPLLVVHS